MTAGRGLAFLGTLGAAAYSWRVWAHFLPAV
jgi:hypothetical protein